MQIWKKAAVNESEAAKLAKEAGISIDFARLLVARGIRSTSELESLIEPEPLCNPFDIIDMEKAAARVERAIDEREKICVYGDYDADGVTATALLMLYFKEKGANAFYYIPDREKEGYGLNADAIKKIAEDGAKLILTVDNGISAVPEAKLIYSLGMELVVTDHHRPGDEIPECEAVVDAHRAENKTAFRDWCGVGIAFKLICALEDDSLKVRKILEGMPGSIRRGFGSGTGDISSLFKEGKVGDLLEKYADIVAAGTIGDVVSLTGENRSIVIKGLKKLSEKRNLNPGIAALINAAGVRPPYTAHSIAFGVVPKINAVGRLTNARAAVELLIGGEGKAEERAKGIVGFNDDRKTFGDNIEADIERIIAENPSCLAERVLIFAGEGWHGGLIGIVAARMCEKYGKPCLVITYDDENAKGSGRSVEGFSLFECIVNCSSLLTHFGGHPMAAGFSLKRRDLNEFMAAVQAYAATVRMPFAAIDIDCELSPDMIKMGFLDEISRLEPFGQDNPQPLFSLTNVTLDGVRFVGKEKNHASLNFREIPTSVMKFRTTESEFPFRPGDRLSLAVTLQKNEYNGMTSVSVHAKDIRFASLDDEKFLRSLSGYDMFSRGDAMTAKQLEFITPDRAFIGRVYKFIKANEGWHFGSDALCARLGDDGGHVCKVALALDVLLELGILERNGDWVSLPKTQKRAELGSSEILKRLGQF